MLKFMIIAAPRSGTAWAANWLSTDRLTCLHDPLWDHAWEDLGRVTVTGKEVGIACTGIAYFHQWVNDQPCPKVILHRPPFEIVASLKKIGLPAPPETLFESLWLIKGMHVHWRSLFGHGARDIHRCLNLGVPFDEERHERLKDLTITAKWWVRKQNLVALARMQGHLL